MEFGLKLRAVPDDPAVNRRVSHIDATLLHEFLYVSRGQRIRAIPANAHQDDFRWKMGPLGTHRHVLTPPRLSLITEADHIANRGRLKICDKVAKVRGAMESPGYLSTALLDRYPGETRQSLSVRFPK